MINYIKNQIKADKNSKLLVEIVNYLNDTIEKCSSLAIEISNLYEKINNISGITVDTELDENSTNAIANSVVTNTTNILQKTIEQVKKSLLLTKSELSELQETVNNLQISGGTGVQYQNSILVTNVSITDISSTAGVSNLVECSIHGKILPIAVSPLDSSATWRQYIIRSFSYDVSTNSTKVQIIATDTSTNINITVMEIIESEG